MSFKCAKKIKKKNELLFRSAGKETFWTPHPQNDVCVFSPNITGLQSLLNICGDCAAEHEITFNCNKTIGLLFCPKKYKQPAPSNVFLNGVRVQFFDQVKYLGVWINAPLKDDDDIQRQRRSQNEAEEAMPTYPPEKAC